MKKNSALIVVDVQPTFIGDSPTKAKAKDGANIVPIINKLIGDFYNIIVVCHHWCPLSAFQPHPDLCLDSRTVFVHKNRTSAFTGKVYNAVREYEIATGITKSQVRPNLLSLLKERDIHQVFVCGLFTEYCVKDTALDSVKNGYSTHLIESACAATNSAHEIDSRPLKSAMDKMKKAGIHFEKKGKV